jgi:O-antigen/teichoic acid export membrane protein
MFKVDILTRYIKDSEYKKNVLVMVAGRIIAQSIPIVITPLLTRMYTPGEFGIFAVYGSVVSLVAMISNGRYCLSIILPKEKGEAKYLVLLSSIFTVFVTILFTIVVLLFRDRFFEILNIEIIDNFILLLSLNILFVGLYEALYFYALREKKFRLLSSNIIIQAFVLVIVRLLTGYLGYTNLGLILSYVLGFFVAYILLLIKLDLKINIGAFRENCRGLISKYSNFPKFSLFSDTLGNLTNSFPNILLNKVFGSGEVGYLSLSDKVLGTPIWFITSSVGDVFKQQASELYRNGKNCESLFIKTSKTLFYVGIIPFLLIFFLVPPLIPFVFGDLWASSGQYVRIFSLMYFSSFVVVPTAHMPYIVDKQQYAALFQGSKIISIVIAFALGYYYESLVLSLVLWSFLITMTNILIFLISYKFAKISKPIDHVQKIT